MRILSAIVFSSTSGTTLTAGTVAEAVAAEDDRAAADSGAPVRPKERVVTASVGSVASLGSLLSVVHGVAEDALRDTSRPSLHWLKLRGGRTMLCFAEVGCGVCVGVVFVGERLNVEVGVSVAKHAGRWLWQRDGLRIESGRGVRRRTLRSWLVRCDRGGFGTICEAVVHELRPLWEEKPVVADVRGKMALRVGGQNEIVGLVFPTTWLENEGRDLIQSKSSSLSSAVAASKPPEPPQEQPPIDPRQRRFRRPAPTIEESTEEEGSGIDEFRRVERTDGVMIESKHRSMEEEENMLGDEAAFVGVDEKSFLGEGGSDKSSSFVGVGGGGTNDGIPHRLQKPSKKDSDLREPEPTPKKIASPITPKPPSTRRVVKSADRNPVRPRLPRASHDTSGRRPANQSTRTGRFTWLMRLFSRSSRPSTSSSPKAELSVVAYAFIAGTTHSTISTSPLSPSQLVHSIQHLVPSLTIPETDEDIITTPIHGTLSTPPPPLNSAIQAIHSHHEAFLAIHPPMAAVAVGSGATQALVDLLAKNASL